MRVNLIRNINILAIYLMLTNTMFAAPEPPPPTSPPVPPGAPLDGHVVLLLLVSIAYGVYKIYQHRVIKKASN